MPNLDFYAVGPDFVPVLGYVFERSGCRVFQAYSDFDQEVREFKSPEEILALCRTSQSVSLQLVSPNANKLFHIRRIALELSTGHRFRYCTEGWGLIQLYLGGMSAARIIHSHTNHNSEARARAWETTNSELGAVSDWDWKEVTRVSSAMNRFIRKLAVGSAFRRPVLPVAARERDAGATLLRVAPGPTDSE